MARLSEGQKRFRERQKLEAIYQKVDEQIAERAANATLVSAAWDALRLLEIYQINLDDSAERRAVIAELKATLPPEGTPDLVRIITSLLEQSHGNLQRTANVSDRLADYHEGFQAALMMAAELGGLVPSTEESEASNG